MPHITRRQTVLAVAAGLGWRRSGPRRTVAFHYDAHFGPDEIAWYKRFGILVTGGILSPQQSETLRAKANSLVAYEWISAFYPNDAASASPEWHAAVMKRGTSWLLNQVPVGGGAAEPGKEAFWYNFGDGNLLEERAYQLAAVVQKSGYAGLFFDTLGVRQLPASIEQEFRRRNPGIDYDRQQGKFLKLLRTLLPKRSLIFLNQGYRNADIYLPHADLDLTESYMTYLRPDGTTGFREWWSGTRPWESVSIPIERLVAPAADKYRNVSFVHLNYAAGDMNTISRAVRYSMACSKLWNHESYLVAPGNAAGERDEAYFADLGRPRSHTYQEDREAGIAWRVFEKGVVAINSGPRAGKIPSLNLHLPDPPSGYLFFS